MKLARQIKPLNHTVAPIWDYATSDYPDLIKVPMEDGQVISYRRDVQQPPPQFQKAMDLVKILKASTFGGYKGRHEDIVKGEEENGNQ